MRSFQAPWPAFDLDAKPFTWCYSQPEKYHHCIDSVETPWRVARLYQNSAPKVLDVCAGCGVMGLEFFFWARNIASIDFLELQRDFVPHLEHNIRLTGLDRARILESSYQSLATHPERYDVVLCNPPYFPWGSGVPPRDAFRRACRFFEHGSHADLLRHLAHVLTPLGRAFVLLRFAPESPEALELRKHLAPQGITLHWWGQVRTTWLVVVTAAKTEC